MSARRLVLGVLCAVAGTLALTSASALAVKEYVPAGTLGSPGSGNGQFNEPAGVAVNESTELVPGAGDVYVADKGNNRVERFSAAGAYLGQFNGSGTFEVEGKVEKGAAAPSGQLGSPALIAVDDSGKSVLEDPSVGDVYVVDAGHNVIDKFGPAGEYISQLTEVEGRAFVQLLGIGVDSAGNLRVLQSRFGGSTPYSEVDEFSDTGSFVQRSFYIEEAYPHGLAVDSKGNVYVVGRGYISGVGGVPEVLVKREASGEQVPIAEHVSAFAIDESTHEVLADKGGVIELYGPFGEPALKPLQTFPGNGLQGSHGIAVSGATNTAYASQNTGDVAIFDYVVLPTVATEQTSAVSETAETVSGTITPEGEAITECKFDYGTETSYGQSIACTQTPAEINVLSKGGTVPVKVSAEVTGLKALTTYDFRLDAADAHGLELGHNETFYTFGRPAVQREVISNVGSTEATSARRSIRAVK